jgi:phosphate/phosphite/phosphonate ABC transporter binding protein
LAIVLVASLSARAEERRLAVLELHGKSVDAQALALLSESARAGALQAARGKSVSVVTRENLVLLLKSAGVAPEDCESECEVETGRKIGADLIVTGDAVRIEDRFVVSLKLHETLRGALLGTRQVSAKTQLALLDETTAATSALVAANLTEAHGKRLTLTFGMQPQWSREQMQKLFGPLMEYLSRQTGHEFRLRVTEDYGALLDEMNSGMIDVAKFSPYGYVLAKKTSGVRIFATELTWGRPWYRGFIIARKDRKYRNIEDLQGKSFCYTDPNSTSGFIYPRALLIERGFDPNAFFREVRYAGSHDLCIRGVSGGNVDAGATWDVALDDMSESKLFGVDGDELMVLHKTERIPNDAYAARPGLDEAVVQQIQQALMALSRDKKRLGDVIDWKTRIDGFVAGEDAAYEVVREKVALKDLKPKLAVLPFDRKGSALSEEPGQVIADVLGTRLFDSQRFLIIERARVDQALSQQRIDSDAASASAAARVGQSLGANLLLAGSVMKLDGKLHITWRLIETDTARVLHAQHARGASLDEAIEEAAGQIVANYDLKGFLLKVRDSQNVTVDLGTLQGLRPGDPLIIYKQGETLVHPVTGKVLGTEEVVLGHVVTTRTTAEISFGKVVDAQELPQQGFRVRTLRKDEAALQVGDSKGFISQYLSEERLRYEPWPKKYAWRFAALLTIPAAWALFKGDARDKLLFGGVAAGLWGVAGGVQLYYSQKEQKTPAYIAVGGSF